MSVICVRTINYAIDASFNDLEQRGIVAPRRSIFMEKLIVLDRYLRNRRYNLWH